MSIEEVSVVSATLFEALLKKFFKDTKASAPGSEGVDISAVADVISNAYNADGPTAGVSAAGLENGESAPIGQLTNRIIEDAYVFVASDIHIEPMEKYLVVRYRIDGRCQEKLRLPKQIANSLVTPLKIMSNLDISERRLPQDRRIVFKKYTKKNIDIDLRVATGPMNHGEKVVMRILDKTKSTLTMPALGFSEENLAKYRECIRQPYGMILHCGPTGSGKSMTLYSAGAGSEGLSARSSAMAPSMSSKRPASRNVRTWIRVTGRKSAPGAFRQFSTAVTASSVRLRASSASTSCSRASSPGASAFANCRAASCRPADDNAANNRVTIQR